LLYILEELKKTLPELVQSVELYPIKTVNIKNINKLVLKKETVISKIENIKQQLGLNSLLLVRPSGTEPLIRVTMSSKDSLLMGSLIDELVSLIQKEGKTI